MRIKRQSGFGHLVLLVRVGAIKLPNAKSCTEIIKDLAHFSYIPCSRRSLVLYFLHTKKKRIPNFWYVVPWDHYFHQKKNWKSITVFIFRFDNLWKFRKMLPKSLIIAQGQNFLACRYIIIRQSCSVILTIVSQFLIGKYLVFNKQLFFSS